jgi:hypothetical protein
VEARAGYNLDIETSPAQVTTLGASGQSYFDVTFSQTVTGSTTWTWRATPAGQVQLEGVDSQGSAASSFFSSLTIDPASTLKLGSGQTYSSGQTYVLIVDWTVARGATVDPNGNGIYFNLFVKQPNGVNANAGATDTITVSVPEASQLAASACLLAGGTAVYAGRRSMRKRIGLKQRPVS